MKRNVKDEKTTIPVLFTLYIHRGLREWLFMSLIRTYITELGNVSVPLAHCKVLNSLSATYLFYWCYRLYQLFKNCTLRIIKTSDCLTYEVLYIKKKIHLRDDLWLDCREKVKKKNRFRTFELFW